jgi:hypothetical protein
MLRDLVAGVIVIEASSGFCSLTGLSSGQSAGILPEIPKKEKSPEGQKEKTVSSYVYSFFSILCYLLLAASSYFCYSFTAS